jgi:hypothetical protein
VKLLLLRVALAVQCVIGAWALARPHGEEPASDAPKERLLAWVDANVPRDAASLLLVGGDEPFFFRASSRLYPRTVIWLSPQDERWGTPLPREPGEWQRLIQRTSARFAFTEGVDPATIPAPGGVVAIDAARGEHLATLR